MLVNKILTISIFIILASLSPVSSIQLEKHHLFSQYKTISSYTSIDTWSKTFGRFFSWEEGTGVHQTSDGGYIVVGYTDSNGPDGIWLIKLDSYGDREWERFLRGYESGNVEQTSDGGYILATYNGEFLSIIKTDSHGDEEWSKNFKSYYPCGDRVVHQTSDGGFIVVGTYDSAYLVKLADNGDVIWFKTYDVQGDYEAGYSVEETSDGGYIFSGMHFSSKIDRGGVWLVKVDVNGTEEWNKTFGSSNTIPPGGGFSVQQTSDGGYIVAGYDASRYPFAGGWIIKTDKYGNKEWELFPKCSSLHSIDQTDDRGYIAVGTTGDSRVPGNLYLIKVDCNGVVKWIKEYGRENPRGGYDYFEEGNCVQQTKDGGYIVVGYRDSSMFGFFMNMDIWVLKTDRNGVCDSLVSGKTNFIYRIINIYMGGVI